MEHTLTKRDTPTFTREDSKTHQKSLMDNTMHESLASFRRSPTTRRRKNKTKVQKIKDRDERNNVLEEEQEDDDDKAEVEKKIVALQRIVPGGESLVGVDKLFEETAGYILALQCQIKAMRVLANFIEGLEKEKRKFGG